MIPHTLGVKSYNNLYENNLNAMSYYTHSYTPGTRMVANLPAICLAAENVCVCVQLLLEVYKCYFLQVE